MKKLYTFVCEKCDAKKDLIIEEAYRNNPIDCEDCGNVLSMARSYGYGGFTFLSGGHNQEYNKHGRRKGS